MAEPSKYKNMTEQTRQSLEADFLGKDTRIALHYHLMEYFDSDSYDNSDKYLRITNLLRRRADVSNLEYNGEFIQEDLNYMGGIVQSAFSGLDSVEAMSLLCDLCAYGAMDIDTVNGILAEDSFAFQIINRDPLPYVDETDAMDLDEFANGADIEPGIRQLLTRMEDAYRREDYSGVLAAGSNVIEAIARRQSNHPRAKTTSFGKVQKMFLQNSPLPDVLKIEFDRIYKSRNTTPNAGHGNLEIDDNTTPTEAATVIAVCYAAVKHYWLFRDKK